MKLINIAMCENCGREEPRLKGVCFKCNAKCFHYFCEKCYKEAVEEKGKFTQT